MPCVPKLKNIKFNQAVCPKNRCFYALNTLAAPPLKVKPW